MKLVGLFLLLGGSVGILWECLRSLRNKEAEFVTLLSFLNFMIGELASFETPLPTLFARAEAKGWYDRSFWQRVAEDDLYTAFLHRKESGCMSEETLSSLRTLCDDLGKSSLEFQLTLCRRCKEEVQTQQRSYLSDLPNRKKIYITLCFTLGGMVLILLW